MKKHNNIKSSTKDFIIKSNIIHNNKYDYSLVDYENNKSKVKIICHEHGIFEQTPNSHLKNHGCPKCYRKIKSNNIDFINKSKKIHGEKCPIHGVFRQLANVHILGCGCQKCANKDHGKHNAINVDIFIEKSNIIHNNKYDYSLTNYINVQKKVKIICKKHGLFEQKPTIHLKGCGCPLCQISKGEEKIKIFLDNKKIIYNKEHRFNNCRYKQPLPFDFYLPDYNMCIEYDGEQHFKKYHKWNDDLNFDIRIKRDQIKNDYCKNNNINLLRIKYTQFNKIDVILTEKLKINK